MPGILLSLPPSSAGVQACATISGFLPEFWESNSDLHARAGSILPAEPSSQIQVSLLVPGNK